MRRGLPLGLAVLWMGAAPAAAAGPRITAEAIAERGKLLGEEKVRYLLRQIDLTEAQAENAQGLIESILSGKASAGTADQMAQVRQLYSEINQAKEANDQQQVAELTRQLQQLGRETTTDADFFMNLEAQLTDAQKQKLEQARARLERVPSGALRPIDLMRVAQELALTAEQRQRLRAGHAGTRELLGPSLRPSVELKLRMINYFADEIRDLLTPQQAAEFELRVCALRRDLIDQGLRPRVPESLANEPAADEKADSPGNQAP